MGAIERLRQRNFTAHIRQRGHTTVVNGQTLKAFWQKATHHGEPFVSREFWQWPVYEVYFPASALLAPVSLMTGATLHWASRNVDGLCMNVYSEGESDTIIFVQATVVTAEPYLPHTAQVFAVVQTQSGSGTAKQVPTYPAQTASVPCLIQSQDATTAFQETGVELKRPHVLVCSGADAASFKVGDKVTWDGAVFFVHAKRIIAADTVLAHGRLTLSESQYAAS